MENDDGDTVLNTTFNAGSGQHANNLKLIMQTA